MNESSLLNQLDTTQLFAIAWRICSENTVDEAKEFASLINQAAQLVTKSGLRIMGVESRDLNDPDAETVERIVAKYKG